MPSHSLSLVSPAFAMGGNTLEMVPHCLTVPVMSTLDNEASLGSIAGVFAGFSYHQNNIWVVAGIGTGLFDYIRCVALLAQKAVLRNLNPDHVHSFSYVVPTRRSSSATLEHCIPISRA